eukprot:8045096-Pyramimonas_sp.AAC.1
MADLEHAREREDHGLISARVAWKGKGGHAPNNAHPRLDRAKFQDKKCCDKFRSMLASASLVPWECELNERVKRVNE